MTHDQAYEILGLKKGATRDDIIDGFVGYGVLFGLHCGSCSAEGISSDRI